MNVLLVAAHTRLAQTEQRIAMAAISVVLFTNYKIALEINHDCHLPNP
jgi:hypothetical protein